jgi:integrase
MSIDFKGDARENRGMKLDRHVYIEPDPAGNDRTYVRRHGRRIRIREKRGSPEFHRQVARALEKLENPTYHRPKGSAHGTLGWVADLYLASAEFKALNPISQRTRRAIIDRCLSVKHKSEFDMRNCPLTQLTAAKVKAIRDDVGDKRGAANKRLQNLSAMFGWAIEAGKMTSNPARDVRKLKYATDGFHTWTVDEVKQFEAKHPIGSKARLALALGLYLGVRRSDVVRLRKDMVRDGVLFLTPAKTSHIRADVSAKPILPVLAEIIAASPTGKESFLETSKGKPFTVAGFGNWFRDRCDEAGLPQCAFHGLRKAGATIAAERGATAHELMALYDWTTVAVAQKYTKQADRKKLAARAADLLR